MAAGDYELKIKIKDKVPNAEGKIQTSDTDGEIYGYKVNTGKLFDSNKPML